MRIQYLNGVYTPVSHLGYCKYCSFNKTLTCSKLPTIICVKYGGFKSSKEKGIFLL